MRWLTDRVLVTNLLLRDFFYISALSGTDRTLPKMEAIDDARYFGGGDYGYHAKFVFATRPVHDDYYWVRSRTLDFLASKADEGTADFVAVQEYRKMTKACVDEPDKTLQDIVDDEPYAAERERLEFVGAKEDAKSKRNKERLAKALKRREQDDAVGDDDFVVPDGC